MKITIIIAFLLASCLHEQIDASRPIHASKKPSTNQGFIPTMCIKTTYPKVCVSSLSPFASTIQNSTENLARASVSVSLNAALSAYTLITKLASNGALSPSEAAAVRDCMPTMEDCVNVLQKSIDGMGRKKLAEWMQMDDVQTWVSGALTDQNTCMGGFSGGEKAAATRAKQRVDDAMQRTSNALALLALLRAGLS
ncbi:hypothetical protein LUZ60_016584 [Juncus effusus]|nr:hypothetical protein LUZ60_016584 [Juncus effusus]